MSIQSNFPAISPSLLLDFANVQQLDPRITFTRASTATYYGTQTAKAEENLLLQSQDFTTTWANVASSDTANTTVAPDGTTTADTILETATTNSHRVQQEVTLVVGQTYTVSVFAKQVLDREFQIAFATSDVSGNPRANFDLTNGTLGTVNSELTATITASTNGFYRCAVTFTAADSLFIPCFSVITEPTAVRFESYAGDITKGVILWGAQLEARSAATAYTPTTTQSITNYIPVLETAASGVARFDHNPTTFESLGLLVEEQRTNLFTYSEDFSDSDWAKTDSSITANTIVAPDGALTGDKFIPASGATGLLEQTQTGSGLTTYTFSIYLKKGEDTSTLLVLRGAAFANRAQVNVNLSTGTLSSIVSVGTFTSAVANIISVGNGWYRVSLTGTTGSGEATIRGRVTSDSSGDGFSGIYIWGAQLEEASFSTSYIPTVASQVTRSADVAVMTGTNFSSWYNAAEGTLYAESQWTTTSARNNSPLFRFDDGTNNNFLSLLFRNVSPSAPASISVRASGGSEIAPTTPAVATNDGLAHKFAGSYTALQLAFSADAQSAGTATPIAIPVVNTARIGASNTGVQSLYAIYIRKLAFYPKALTAAELAGLTQI